MKTKCVHPLKVVILTIYFAFLYDCSQNFSEKAQQEMEQIY
jgi:hypothetical protein